MIKLYYIARRVDFKRRKGANLRFIFLLKSLLDHVPHYSKDIPTFLDWWLYTGMLSWYIMRVEYYFIIIRLRSIHYWISLSCEWETHRLLYMYRYDFSGLKIHFLYYMSNEYKRKLDLCVRQESLAVETRVEDL